MKILLFGGTTEGRELAAALAQAGHEVSVSVATALGAEQLPEKEGLSVLTGPLDGEAIGCLVRGYDLCVDATHPYAREVSRNIRSACEAEKVPLERIVRAAFCEAELEGSCCLFDTVPEAAGWLSGQEGPILLTTGTRDLAGFSCIDPERLYARILPCHESLEACERAGIPHRNIIAMQGPFTARMNAAMLEQYHIRYLVTKESGDEGGFRAKLEAARESGTQVCLIRRPRENGISAAQLLEKLACGYLPEDEKR